MKSNKSLDSLTGQLLFSTNIAKNTLGSFMVFLPWVMDRTGIVLGFTMFIFVYFICVYTFVLIGYLGKKADVNSYSKIFTRVGPWAVISVDVSIMLLTLLASAGYIIFVKQRMQELIMIIGNFNKPPISTTLIAVIYSLCILLPLSIPKNLHTLRFLSFMAFAAIVIMIGLAIYYYGTTDTSLVEVNTMPPNFFEFVIGFPIFAGNFDCHTNAMEYYIEYCEHTSHTKFKRYVKLVFLSMLMVLVTTTVFSTFFYMAVGRGVQDDPILFIKNKYIKCLMSSTLIISLTISYAQFLQPIRSSMHNLFFEAVLKRNYEMTKKARYIETFIIVLLTMVIAVLSDNIGYFNGCSWSLFGSLLLFVYPTALAIKMDVLKSNWLRVLNIGVLVYGVVVSLILGLAISIYLWAQ